MRTSLPQRGMPRDSTRHGDTQSAQRGSSAAARQATPQQHLPPGERGAAQQALGQLAAVSPRTARTRAVAALAHASPAQLKREYVNGGPNHVEKAWRQVQDFERAEEIVEDKRLNYSQFLYGFTGLTTSPLDYGTIDLDSPQQIALLYFQVRKQAEDFPGMREKELHPVAAPDEDRQKSIDAGKVGRQHAEQRERDTATARADREYVENSPDPANTMELAFIGAGAAVAYYLASMAGNVHGDRTIVIGDRQPWAGGRGPGVVNHPQHMISASRGKVGLDDERLMPRAEFAEDVEEAIRRRVWRRITRKATAVDKVSAQGTWFYKIDIDDGRVFYAKKVVAALGIGPHMDRTTFAADSPVAESVKKERVMNMDMFQQQAPGIHASAQNPADVKVFIAGGNAAIDVVKTCLDLGFKIIWYPGQNAPQFLQGTDNEVVEAEFLKFRTLATKASSRLEHYEETRAGPVGAGSDGYPLKINGRNAHYFVFGQGPDVAKVSNIFHTEHILDKLVTTKDRNRYFHGTDGTARLDEDVTGGRAALGLQMPARENDPTALEIIGGTAFRMPVSAAEIAAHALPGEPLKESEKRAQTVRTREYEAVIASLPGNVAGNDQLAPIRAQVEASHGFVPPYVEDDVNMAVDNITVIAIHIAARYPHLTPADADMWADRIIRWRRPSAADIETYRMLRGPIPNPHAQPRENAHSFSAWFKRRLTEENEKAKLSKR